MTNLQLYVEIMSLGAEGRGGKSRVTSQSRFWVGEARRGARKAQETLGALAKPGRTGAAPLGMGWT